MQVRQVAVSDADKASAKVFFTAVSQFYDLRGATALDMFARTGDLTVTNYRDKVQHLHLWELGSEHYAALAGFSPDSIRIGCSYQSATISVNKFDFVVVDSPQGAHHDYQGLTHYEHFDMLRDHIPNLLMDEAVVVLYVNKRPYNRDEIGEHGYDTYAEYNFQDWMNARAEFYGSCVISEEEAVRAYRRVFAEAGFSVVGMVLTPCYSDVPGYAPYAFRLALKVVRVSH